MPGEQPAPTDPIPPFPVTPVSPEILAWARQTLVVEEFLDGFREVEATGGVPLEAFIAEVEAEARKS